MAEVARRAGNSPEVIHGRYEGCIDGHEELNNKKTEEAMGWGWPRAFTSSAVYRFIRGARSAPDLHRWDLWRVLDVAAERTSRMKSADLYLQVASGATAVGSDG
ncbi:conserved hypothetical protein [Streptomyces sviceus ATCC 29083]|uniref:Uncharacterized protein n=1 Tax=Streptomyces sviceus (strain ATCC 29083 / DSM 924 / JCM 4929 / NBRC 13980 / NCIMB 11184 / NRRL 5439 / UC 5370) TaxID=463191 RepID=D6XAP7_STRX2|nr:conserved hypothetical protein [Streptomyces sviceus ATCC 29083]